MAQFTKNTLITLTSRILQLILGIALSVILARGLGPQGKGIFALVILFQTLLINFTDFGIGPASVFYIGKKKYPLSVVFGANIIFSILISGLAISLGVILLFFFGDKILPQVPSIYLYLILILIPLWFFLNILVNILLALQKIKKYNLLQLTVPLVFLGLASLLWLTNNFSIQAVIISQIIAYVLADLVLAWQIKKEVQGLSFALNRTIFQNFFSYGIKNYLSNVLSFFHYKIDMFLVNIFLNPAAVGFYSIAVGLSQQIWLISEASGTVLFPRISSETNQKNLKEFTPLVCRNILFISLILTAVLFFIGRHLIVLLYSQQFFNAIAPFQILLVGTVMISAWRILANDLSGRGKPMLNVYINAITAIVNVVLNILLIPKFGIAGAAWATSASYTAALIIIVIVYSRISGNQIKDILLMKKADFKVYYYLFILIKKRYFGHIEITS